MIVRWGSGACCAPAPAGAALGELARAGAEAVVKELIRLASLLGA